MKLFVMRVSFIISAIIIVIVSIKFTFSSNYHKTTPFNSYHTIASIYPTPRITSFFPQMSNLPVNSTSEKCVLTDVNNKTTIVYINKNKIRVDLNSQFISIKITNLIYDGAKLYVFDSVAKQGLIINSSFLGNNLFNQPYINNEIKQLGEKSQTCTKENIPDSLFIVPEDIIFKNFSQGILH